MIQGTTEHSRRIGWREWMIALGVVIVTFAVFSPAIQFAAVNFDDLDYFTKNEHVLGGVTGENIGWALTTTKAANWHPLTWISLMVDAQVWGGNPDDSRTLAGVHGINVALHAITAGLTFLLLRSLTGTRWWSCAGAVVFAIHPLRVESVAWISERKDALSMVFGLLALLAYVQWARRGGAWRMGLTVAMFAIGLTAKPMLVSIPGVMLLLDVWPLRRWRGSANWESDVQDEAVLIQEDRRGRTIAAMVMEKWALIVLTILSCVVTVYAQKTGGAVKSLESLPIGERVINSGMSVWMYLYQTVWPKGLAVFYPMRRDLEAWMGIAAWGGVIVVTIAGWVLRKRIPGMLTGWTWYLWALLPVIGLVQVGLQGHADRYTYLPTIGIVVGVVSVASKLSVRSVAARTGLTIAAFAIIGASAWLTEKNLAYWRNSGALFEHAMLVTKDNYMASGQYGMWVEARGDEAKEAQQGEDARRLWREAISYYDESLRAEPAYASMYHNRGNVLFKLRNLKDAEEAYRMAVRLTPESWESNFQLGQLLMVTGKSEEAMAFLEAALANKPDLFEAHTWLAQAHVRRGNLVGAREEVERALEIAPDDAKGLKLREEIDRAIRASQGMPTP